MKNLLKPLYFFLAIAVTLGACKKEDAKIDASATGASATVTAGGYGFDGNNAGKFSSTKAAITQVSVNGIGTFSVTAIRDGGNESINIVVLKKITAVGKISFGPDITNGGITIMKNYTNVTDRTLSYTTDQSSSTGTKGGGEINVTKLEGNKVEGTFYAVAHNSAGKAAFVEQGTFSGTIVSN